jgi:hypothetical protein
MGTQLWFYPCRAYLNPDWANFWAGLLYMRDDWLSDCRHLCTDGGLYFTFILAFRKLAQKQKV